MTLTATKATPTRDTHTTTIAGPNPYAPAAGWVLDLTAQFEWLDWLKIRPVTVGPNWDRATIIVYALNVAAIGSAPPAGGKAVLALNRIRYNRFGGITVGATSQPAGVTVQNALANTSAGGAHLHTINHTHPQQGTGTPNASGIGVATGVGGPNLSNHTHSFSSNITGEVTFSGNSGNESAHVHPDPVLYDHTHANTQAATQLSLVAYAAVDLSGATFALMAAGQ